MIVPYFGEFLLTPIPLELSMNFCSHKCAYCFANLNMPGRKAAVKQIVNLLADYQNRDTLTARLLQAGYPILMSNKSDPFAASNYRLTLSILELLAALKIPVAFQTRGGKGIEEAMSLIGPSCFYFSLTCQDDATAAKIEPGAPSMSKRFEQMAMLKAAGHHVWAGVNPLVPAWIPDVVEFAKRLKGAGIEYVWSEILHLTSDQIKNMTPREKEAIGEPVLAEARKKCPSKENFNHELDFIDACRSQGIVFGCKHWPDRTGCLDPYRERYPKLFPSMTEFTNHAVATMQPGDEITFDDWKNWMLRDLPAIPKKREFASYIYSCNRKLGKFTATDHGMDYQDVLKIVWLHKEHRMCPSRSFAFKKVRIGEVDGTPIFKEDQQGIPVRYYTGKTLERR